MPGELTKTEYETLAKKANLVVDQRTKQIEDALKKFSDALGENFDPKKDKDTYKGKLYRENSRDVSMLTSSLQKARPRNFKDDPVGFFEGLGFKASKTIRYNEIDNSNQILATTEIQMNHLINRINGDIEELEKLKKQQATPSDQSLSSKNPKHSDYSGEGLRFGARTPLVGMTAMRGENQESIESKLAKTKQALHSVQGPQSNLNTQSKLSTPMHDENQKNKPSVKTLVKNINVKSAVINDDDDIPPSPPSGPSAG